MGKGTQSPDTYESSRRDLHNALRSTALQFENVPSLKKFAEMLLPVCKSLPDRPEQGPDGSSSWRAVPKQQSVQGYRARGIRTGGAGDAARTIGEVDREKIRGADGDRLVKN